MTRDTILETIKKVSGEKEIHLEFPENEAHGDYSTNIAMLMFSITPKSQKAKSPKELAKEYVDKLKKDRELAKVVGKIEVAGPGFINFWLSKETLFGKLKEMLEDGDKYGKVTLLKGKKYLLEHTSPNTIKSLHVGHVRNNVLGMAVHNILEFSGAEVKMDAINNDRGIHVMKAVWAYQNSEGDREPKSKEKPDHFVNDFYVKGVEAGEDKKIREEMQVLLIKWEEGDKEVWENWKKLRDWTFEGFMQTYKRLGSWHDQQWFESDFYAEGKKIVKEGLKRKVFRKLDDGAVLSNLKKYKLPEAIILRADGTSMYHTQDLRLTELKRERFPSDLYIWDIGPEQSLYLKQLFAICEQLEIGKREDYFHLSYGFVFLKTGEKMSSRRGNVISADWLMDEMVRRARKIIEKSKTPRQSLRQDSRGLSKKEIGEVAEAVGIGAIKYGFLKPARETDIHFDLEESLSLEGNSGPYLQYTHARTQSVLHKVKGKRQESKRVKIGNKQSLRLRQWKLEINPEELAILRTLPRFAEVVEQSARNYAPNLLCNYLYVVAQKYNVFYNKHKILEPADSDHRSPNTSEFRLALTAAVGQVLKNGLGLLGIETPIRM
jgi:arginyl-tRNA synthetase